MESSTINSEERINSKVFLSIVSVTKSRRNVSMKVPIKPMAPHLLGGVFLLKKIPYLEQKTVLFGVKPLQMRSLLIE